VPPSVYEFSNSDAMNLGPGLFSDVVLPSRAANTFTMSPCLRLTLQRSSKHMQVMWPGCKLSMDVVCTEIYI
jgi:hypothetical protein